MSSLVSPPVVFCVIAATLVWKARRRYSWSEEDLKALDPKSLKKALDDRLFSLLVLLCILLPNVFKFFHFRGWFAPSLPPLFLFLLAQSAIFWLWLIRVFESSSLCASLIAFVSFVYYVTISHWSGNAFEFLWRASSFPGCCFVLAAIHYKIGFAFTFAMSVWSLLAGQSVPVLEFDQALQKTGAVYIPMTTICFGCFVTYLLVRDNLLRSARIESNYEELTKQKDAFVAVVSHEIRTPLHGMSASADLLWHENRSASANEHLIAIRHCTAANSKPLQLKEVEFHSFVQDVFNFSKALVVANKLITVRLSVSPSLLGLVVKMCEMEVKQIVTNFVSNAIKFSYSDRPQEVCISFAEDGEGFVLAEVMDEGIGVRKDFQSKLFEAYSRDCNTVSGTGLGLMISRKAARRIGGDCFYRPRDGGGSCFAARFPVIAVAKLSGKAVKSISHLLHQSQLTSASSGNSVDGQSVEMVRRGSGRGASFDLEEQVVIAEDNPINTRVICAMLKRENVVPVAVLQDGASCLQFLLNRIKQRDNSRVLLLVDNSMPFLTGTTIAKLWRTIEQEASVERKARIWLVTASNAAKTPELDGVLHKPVSLNSLHDVLKMKAL